MSKKLDTDTLDMAGNWKLTYGYSPGLLTDKAGHWIPAGQVNPYWITLKNIGPGDHGVKFNGSFDINTDLTVKGETLYGGNGVQVVQMRIENQKASPGYYELLFGRHQVYKPNDPVEILGGWVSTSGSSNIGNFVLVKVTKPK